MKTFIYADKEQSQQFLLGGSKQGLGNHAPNLSMNKLETGVTMAILRDGTTTRSYAITISWPAISHPYKRAGYTCRNKWAAVICRVPRYFVCIGESRRHKKTAPEGAVLVS
ncbi:hypothetical protein [Janthinobacterium sp. ROICE36]|uniref:hypothetical protein n=1 Tax=Janthinobacterium sp. ROICE36 TaxID=2048670 RepID=UPI0015E15B75|nr:hypothetical protein [Janthinobacterium sp. ROICE36]